MKSRHMLMVLLLTTVLAFLGCITVCAAENENMAVTNEESVMDTQVVPGAAEQELNIRIPVTTAAQPSEQEETVEENAVEETAAEEKVQKQTKKDKKKKVIKGQDKKKKDKKQSVKKGSKKVKKKTNSYSKADLRMMSAIIYCEAGNQSYAGKLGVGIVVMNRKASSSFPNTVRGVVYERGQFTPSWNGALSRALADYDRGGFTSEAEKSCIKAAKAVLGGKKDVVVYGKKYNMKNYYFFSRYVSGARLRIGAHQFK